MTNDDKQLIKDIAVMCGKTLTEVTCSDGFWFCDENCEEFNPLAGTIESKAFCWDLMIKNDIATQYIGNGYRAVSNGDYCADDYDENPQRAVLLAVRQLNNPTV